MSRMIVIICTFRRSSSLGACLDSLTSQATSDSHLLVVGVKEDPASGDVAADRGVPFVAQAKPEGIASARNFGIKCSTDPFVAFIDDDARARPGWTEALLGALEDRCLTQGKESSMSSSGKSILSEFRMPFGTTSP